MSILRVWLFFGLKIPVNMLTWQKQNLYMYAKNVVSRALNGWASVPNVVIGTPLKRLL
jgi:hypothetical protein